MTILLYELEPPITVRNALDIPTVISTLLFTSRGVEVPAGRKIVLGQKQIGDRAGGAVLHTYESEERGVGTAGFVDGSSIEGRLELSYPYADYTYMLPSEDEAGFTIYCYVLFRMFGIKSSWD